MLIKTVLKLCILPEVIDFHKNKGVEKIEGSDTSLSRDFVMVILAIIVVLHISPKQIANWCQPII